ncbi:MAG: hypothetical protein FWD56_03610 [Bacteroidales bacterium]|nr:hypothetical protein [Bacteroidales bacterium]
MKKIILLLTMVSLAGTAFVANRTPVYSPVYVSRATLESSVKYIPGAREMVQTGKIYYRAPYIYVNERYKGVHVINNANPVHPVNEGFILAPGCIDMAVKGKILYLDNAVDLVSFDLDSREVTSRIREVFPEPLPPIDFHHYGFERKAGYVLVEWKKNP